MTELESIDLATVTESVFAPHVQTEFTLRSEAGTFPAVLIEVSRYPDHGDGAGKASRRAPFALVFRCESGALPQGSYHLDHPSLPSCTLFLSPFDGGENWCALEAIFN